MMMSLKQKQSAYVKDACNGHIYNMSKSHNDYMQYAACARYACVQNAYILHTCILHVFCVYAKYIFGAAYAQFFFVFCTHANCH